MGEWRLTGIIDGSRAVASWDGGRLRGRPEVVERLGQVDGFVALTPTGPFLRADVTEAGGALAAAVGAFERVDTLRGPLVDRLLKIPDGAVA